jgi:uncharacterized protein
MSNPFVYSRPVEPADLVDRGIEAGRLVELAEGGHATRLMAPRRYGKTSLLYLVKRDAERLDMACVYVDFSRAVAVADVAITIEEAYRRSLQGRVRRTAVAVLRSLDVRGRVTPGGVGLEVGRRGEADVTRRLGDLLDLPLALHERTGRRTLVIFDEFQELLSAGDGLDGLLRSRIQHHGDAASYIYAGSRPSLLRELFAPRERPLYGQAQPMHLDPLADPDLADYIGDRFEQTGRDAGSALESVLDVAEGHPQRAMMLAHHLWAATSKGERADAETFARTLDLVRAEVRDALQAEWDSLERSERVVLAALASTDEPLLGIRTLERFGVAKSTAREARDRLVGQGLLHEMGEDVRIVDPLLADFAGHRTAGSEERYARYA